MRARAVSDSTMGTARGNTQGSWRPSADIMTGLPSLLMVFCSFFTVEVGLKYNSNVMASPVAMPPTMPPARLLAVPILPSVEVHESLFSDPNR